MKTKQLVKKVKMNQHLGKPDNQDIKNLFGNSANSESDIVKELFSGKSIKSRTEVSDREISIISRLYFLAEYIDNPPLENMLQNFLELKLSRKRKSREEFIKALANIPKNEVNIPGI